VTEPLNAAAIVDVLNRHGVRFIVIGAFAAIAQRAPIPATRDIDLTPDSSVKISRDSRRLSTALDGARRRSTALEELGTRVRSDAVNEEFPFDHDGRSLAASSVWNLICPYGEFDISFVPSGIAGGYEELAVRAHRMRVDAIDIMVADLSDVIRSKEAAGLAQGSTSLPRSSIDSTASVARAIRRTDGRRVATVRTRQRAMSASFPGRVNVAAG
jgi:hypothetical protein